MSADQRGFTLIELLVVVTVIGILVVFGVPSWASAQQRANDRATEVNVRNALVATRIWYNQSLSYTDVPADMNTIEPALVWTTAPLDGSAESSSIQIKVYDDPSAGPAQTVIVAGRTKTGRCFYIKDTAAGSDAGTFFDAKVSGSAACPTPDPSDPGWADRWSTT